MSGQDELFSAVANQALYKTVTVYASREGVNVIIPGTGYRGEGNHLYERPRGAVRTWAKDLIHDAAKSEGLDFTREGWEVLYSSSRRAGHYTFSVWMPKGTRVQVRGVAA